MERMIRGDENQSEDSKLGRGQREMNMSKRNISSEDDDSGDVSI
jgi:hypothetical protein